MKLVLNWAAGTHCIVVPRVSCVSEFRDDPTMTECPFSTNSITLEELGVVEEIAKNLGLYVTPRRLQARTVF